MRLRADRGRGEQSRQLAARNADASIFMCFMLQRFPGGLFHDRARGGFAGPDLELAHGLFDEHFEAGNHRLALLAGAAHQHGFERVVDHVEHHFAGDVAVEEALVHVGEHAERRGVHHGVELTPGELLAAERFGAADFGERAHAVGIAAHQRDVGAGIGKRESRAARRSAVAHDQHRGFRAGADASKGDR